MKPMKRFLACLLLALALLPLGSCGNRKKGHVAQPVPTATYGTGYGFVK